MNIIEAEDMVKGLPDQVLFQEAQFPSGRIPQYLAVSEVQRRQDMRQRFQAQQAGQEQPTVKDQILQGGIAAVGGPPPQMQPPPMAPPMAPPMQPQPPVMAAAGGMMPYTMQKGGGVPQGQQNPSVFREFMRRNFATPQGLAANIGLVGGAMLGGPVGAGIGGNLGTYIGQKIATPPPPMPMLGLTGGLREPEGGSIGGGSGGGLPYGGPTSYNDQSYLRDLINQFGGGGRRGVVTVEEIPSERQGSVTVEELPQGMAVGGMVPSRISDAIGSALTPAPSESQSSLPSTGPSRDTVLRKIKALMAQGREMDALVLLRQYGISPSEVSMATGGMTPGGIVYMSQGQTVPSINLTEQGILSLLNKYLTSSEVSPEEKALRELIAQQAKQGLPAPIDYSPLIKQSEAAQKEALDTARSQGISAALMQLGAGLTAGDIAGGQQRAAEAVSGIMSRGRQEAAAERQYGRQLQMQGAESQRQAQLAQMNFVRENAKALADLSSTSRKEADAKFGTALNVVTNYTNASLDRASRAEVEGKKISADAERQKQISRDAFLDTVREGIRSFSPKPLEGRDALKPDLVKKYNQDLRRAINLAYRSVPYTAFYMTREEVDKVLNDALAQIDEAATPVPSEPNQGSDGRPPIGGFERPQG